MSARGDAATEADPAGGAVRAGKAILPEHIRALRLGHGANCSSVGSVIDTLFLGAAVGGAIFAAVCAAMRDEPIRVVGVAEGDDAPRPSLDREGGDA